MQLVRIDLLPDNVEACRIRLLDVVDHAHETRFQSPLPENARQAIAFILSRNIVQGDALTLHNAEARPIVFPEWSPVNSTMLKRRDFAYDHLLHHAQAAALPLFSDHGRDVYLPTPVGNYAPRHYLDVPDMETEE